MSRIIQAAGIKKQLPQGFLKIHTAAAGRKNQQEMFLSFLLNRTEQKSGPHMVQYSEPC